MGSKHSFMKLFNETTSKILLWTGIGLLVIGIVFFIFNDTIYDSNMKIDSSKFGQFGDYIGGLIGSLWALAGVILFYVALTEQRDDIKTNRSVFITQVNALEQQIKEFELQREELELTREVFIDQSKTLKLQQFESTFFNSLNLLNNIIQSITYKFPPPSTHPIARFGRQQELQQQYGRDCFEYFYKDLKKEYEAIYQENVLVGIGIVSLPSEPVIFSMPIQEEITNAAYKKKNLNSNILTLVITSEPSIIL